MDADGRGCSGPPSEDELPALAQEVAYELAMFRAAAATLDGLSESGPISGTALGGQIELNAWIEVGMTSVELGRRKGRWARGEGLPPRLRRSATIKESPREVGMIVRSGVQVPRRRVAVGHRMVPRPGGGDSALPRAAR